MLYGIILFVETFMYAAKMLKRFIKYIEPPHCHKNCQLPCKILENKHVLKLKLCYKMYLLSKLNIDLHQYMQQISEDNNIPIINDFRFQFQRNRFNMNLIFCYTLNCLHVTFEICWKLMPSYWFVVDSWSYDSVEFRRRFGTFRTYEALNG
jgi:hypothetical protein